ncbi:hypothetical protein QE152_g38515 [Popillia japonica]|uniref:Uncharacterized protein n=1 Tax=Popillia japonica TaxID=7064 RepID=A0AAW1HWD9_POPJA
MRHVSSIVDRESFSVQLCMRKGGYRESFSVQLCMRKGGYHENLYNRREGKIISWYFAGNSYRTTADLFAVEEAVGFRYCGFSSSFFFLYKLTFPSEPKRLNLCSLYSNRCFTIVRYL